MKVPILMYEVPIKVTVRKYPVDIKRLQGLLRSNKIKSNAEIANELGIPITQVEHYFRRDKYFAIPDPDIWLKLKESLEIRDTSFDESIMTFERVDGVFEKANRFYSVNGISPTILTGEEIKIFKF